MSVGIIIQARIGSRRLPGKILLDFFNGRTILDLLYNRFVTNTPYIVVVATTTSETDNALFEFCVRKNIRVFRGSEHDVLSRFIDTSRNFNFSHIVRVCSDNPFIYAPDITRLTDILKTESELDYVSFKIGKSPSILTHYGFWTEIVSLKALEIANQAKEGYYHEHVTNFIYENPEQFKIKWVNIDGFIQSEKNIRLTVDDINDFRNAQTVYRILGEYFSPETIVALIKDNKFLSNHMAEQILKNKK
jgi:spore coat polysaccharide biosynthesis protein SpsF